MILDVFCSFKNATVEKNYGDWKGGVKNDIWLNGVNYRPAAKWHLHISNLKKEAHSVRIDYELMRTDEPLDEALFRYLLARGRRV